MNKQILVEKLEKMGLSEDESEIYLFLLENGPRSPLELSRQTNINRSKIYRLIEVMQEKKLLEDTKTAWGQKLVAAPPDNLELIIARDEEKVKQKKIILDGIIDDLLELPGESESSFQIKYYKGLDGIKQMFWNGLKAKEETLIFGYDSIDKFVGWDFAERLRKESVRRKIYFYELTNDDLDDSWTDIYELLAEYQKTKKVDKKLLTIKQYTEIHDNLVRIYNMDEKERIGIEIINKNYAEMIKQIFWHYWEIAESTDA